MTRIVVAGAGMAGLLSAIKLQEAGITDLAVYEKADRLGGTWRENTYPGVACDVPSHLYRYSFAPNPEWSHLFAPGEEIQSYLEDVADRFEVEKYISYDTEIARMEWCDGHWSIETTDGRRDVADFVIAATGVLHHPSYPDIDGLDSFDGALFHSARFDHSVPLEGKRVGIVGTGSTAIQMTGALVGSVGDLHLFQRTAQWILPVPNRPIDEADKAHYREDPTAMQAVRDEMSATFEQNFANAVIDAASEQVQIIQQLCEANLNDTVIDPDLRERLRPTYQAACKRLILSGDFYDAIQRPNAHLVTERIERIEPSGIRTTDGVLHQLDVIVLATGFRVDRFMRPIEVVGRNGVSLDDVWAQRPSAYLAVSIPDFPNLFMLNGPNGPVGNFSLIDVAEHQLSYVMQLMAEVTEGRAAEVSASHQAAERFEADRVEAAKKTIWVTGCRSWYLDDRGIPAAWPWTMTHFRERMARPDLADYDLITR